MTKKKGTKAGLNADVKDIIDAIHGVFGDTSVSKATTLELMEEIAEAVDSNIEVLREEIRKDEHD